VGGDFESRRKTSGSLKKAERKKKTKGHIRGGQGFQEMPAENGLELEEVGSRGVLKRWGGKGKSRGKKQGKKKKNVGEKEREMSC